MSEFMQAEDFKVGAGMREKKIIKGAKEALAVARGDIPTISNIRVTPSCGCVFCDIGLKPWEDGIHRGNGHEVKCCLVLGSERGCAANITIARTRPMVTGLASSPDKQESLDGI